MYLVEKTATFDRWLVKLKDTTARARILMTDKLTAFDAADYLRDEESIAEYLNALLEEEDEDLLLSGIGDIAKARGMTRIAEKTGLGRESLYKALAPGAKPRFETIMRVLHSLGVDLAAVARKAAL